MTVKMEKTKAPPIPRAMGVDPSTKTGVVVLEAMDPRPSCLSSIVATGDGTGLARARMIAARVTEVAVKLHPQVVVIEGYGFANKHSLADLVEIGTLIRDRLWKSGFQYVEATPTQLKKFVLGKGVGKKDQMRLGVFKRWGYENESDDVVDAYGLAAIGLAWLGKQPNLIKPQVEVISNLPRAQGAILLPRRDR